MMTTQSMRYHLSPRPRRLRKLHRNKSLRDTLGAALALAAAIVIAVGAGALGWLLLHAALHQ